MNVDAIVAERASAQHGLITRRQLGELCVTRSARRHRLTSGRWIEIQPGVYAIAGALASWEQQLNAAVLGAGDSAAASHLSAAALNQIPGFPNPLPHYVSEHGAIGGRMNGVHVFESLHLPEHHKHSVQRIAVTTVARTLFDLAGRVHPARIERALDNALASRRVTIPSCWRVFIELAEHGRVGTVRMRALLEARSGDFIVPPSVLERRLLSILHEHGLPAPTREVDLGDRDGWVGHVELVYHDVALLVEADSRRHHSSFLDQAADRRHDNQFMAEGFRVLRFTWDDITTRPTWVAETVRRAHEVVPHHLSAS